MRTAFNSINIIGERVDIFTETVIVLHGDFDKNAVAIPFKVNHIRMNRRFIHI